MLPLVYRVESASVGSSSVRYLSQSWPIVYLTLPASVFSFNDPSCPSSALHTDDSVGYLSMVKICDLMRRTPSGLSRATGTSMRDRHRNVLPFNMFMLVTSNRHVVDRAPIAMNHVGTLAPMPFDASHSSGNGRKTMK
jgi:hypothetical protein